MRADLQKIKDVYKDWDMFLSKQGPEELIKNYYQFTNIQSIVSVRRITLEELQEVYEFKDAKAGMVYFKEWLLFLNKYSGVTKGINIENIRTLVIQLYAKYKHYTLPDLSLILDRILEDYYDKSKFYGSIDVQSILTPFRLYNEERLTILGRLKDERDKELKAKRKLLWDKLKAEEYNKVLADESFKGSDPFAEADRRTELRLKAMINELAV